MPMRTAEVSLNGQVLATYEVRWHEIDDAPTNGWITHWAANAATDEFNLAEEASSQLTVMLGPPP
jgi:hypothetical protein